jgi:hypothetical protein
MKYCIKCGKECVRELVDGFNPCSGERNFVEVCSTKECGHAGTDHIWVYPSFFATLIGRHMVTCARPGCSFSRPAYDGI